MDAEIITDEGMKGVRQQMEDEHFANVDSALLHASFLVPVGMRFTYEGMYKLLNSLDYKLEEVPEAMKRLIKAGTLLFGYIDPNWTTKLYYLDRSARKEYEERLRRQRESGEPEKRDISKQLQELAGKVRDTQESVFLDETLKCLRADANRAAIVMAWNLAYHHVRTWILTHHEPAFNAELTSRPRSKTKTYDPVSSHDDFPDGEWFVLDVCRAARFLDAHRFEILEGALKKRNRYAHPSPAKASGPEATGYVAELLENVLLDPYFAC